MGVFTHQPHFSCSLLSLICLSTNQNIQLIHSLLIRIEWSTGNGISESSSHWPIYNTFPPGQAKKIKLWVWTKSTSVCCVDHCVSSSVHSVKDVPSTQQIFSHCQLFLIQQPIPKNKTKPFHTDWNKWMYYISTSVICEHKNVQQYHTYGTSMTYDIHIFIKF